MPVHVKLDVKGESSSIKPESDQCQQCRRFAAHRLQALCSALSKTVKIAPIAQIAPNVVANSSSNTVHPKSS